MVDMPTYRSLLFVPGDRPDRFARALSAGADAVCLDLEDSDVVERPRRGRPRKEVASAGDATE